MDPEDQLKALEMVNKELIRREDLQLGVGETIDKKAIVLLGFAGAGAQFLSSRPDRWACASWIALVLYGCAVAAGAMCIRLRAYDIAPEPKWLVERFQSREQDDRQQLKLLGEIVGTRAVTIRSVTAKDEIKSRWWWATLFCLLAAVVSSVISLGVGSDDEPGPAGQQPSASSSTTSSSTTSQQPAPNTSTAGG